MTLDPFRSLSMRRQVMARLLLALGISAVVIVALGLWFQRYANQRVIELRAERAVEHFRGELSDLELRWGREAFGFKSRLEYSRVLEDPRLRVERFYAFLTAQSSALDFPLAYIAERASGLPQFGYARGQETLPTIRLAEGQEAGWHFDAATRHLYRVFRQPVWIGSGNADLYLLRAVDHALLVRISDPETELAAFWAGRPVASSAGEAGLRDAALAARDPDRPFAVRTISWSEGEAAGPQLMLRVPARTTIGLDDLLVPLLVGLTVFLLVAWALIGRWMIANVRRLSALERGSHGFVQARQISEVVRGELDAAVAGVRDELSQVAISLEYLMHDAVAHEIELQESEQRYRFLVEGVHVVAWEYDPASEAFSYVSPLVEELFGYPVEDWRRPGFLAAFVHHEDRLAVTGIMQAGPDAARRIEFRVLTHDGRQLWVEAIASLVAESEGRRGFVRGVLIDVSERKASEERLALAGMVFESAAEGIMVTDADGHIVTVNPAFEAITGYAATEVVGANPRILGSERQDRRLFRDFWAALNRDGQWSGEVINRRKDGVDYVQRTSVSNVYDARGRVVRRVMLCSDVSDERRKEEEIRRLNATLERRVVERTRALDESNAQLRQALETVRQAQSDLVRAEKLAGLGSIVAGVAHEMNTPIGNCLTVASALAERTQDLRRLVDEGRLRRSDLAGFVESAENAATMLTRSMERAHELVSNFKQVAVDQTSEKRRVFDLAAVIEENLGMLRPGFKHSPHRVDNLVPQGIRMDSYPGPLGQVIANLVGNAMRHAFESIDAGTLSISALPDGEMVVLRFDDDGVGMDEAVRKRAFDPFFTTKFGRGGTGLGLHLVYNIVTGVLGGTVALDSAPGRGCHFTLRIPTTAPEPPPAPE